MSGYESRRFLKKLSQSLEEKLDNAEHAQFQKQWTVRVNFV